LSINGKQRFTFIKQEAKKKVEVYLNEDTLFEYKMYYRMK